VQYAADDLGRGWRGRRNEVVSGFEGRRGLGYQAEVDGDVYGFFSGVWVHSELRAKPYQLLEFLPAHCAREADGLGEVEKPGVTAEAGEAGSQAGESDGGRGVGRGEPSVKGLAAGINDAVEAVAEALVQEAENSADLVP
jgi:hypothetical protein